MWKNGKRWNRKKVGIGVAKMGNIQVKHFMDRKARNIFGGRLAKIFAGLVTNRFWK